MRGRRSRALLRGRREPPAPGKDQRSVGREGTSEAPRPQMGGGTRQGHTVRGQRPAMCRGRGGAGRGGGISRPPPRPSRGRGTGPRGPQQRGWGAGVPPRDCRAGGAGAVGASLIQPGCGGGGGERRERRGRREQRVSQNSVSSMRNGLFCLKRKRPAGVSDRCLFRPAECRSIPSGPGEAVGRPFFSPRV